MLKLKSREESLIDEQALAFDTLGSVLLESGKPNEAMDCHKRAISLKPDFIQAHLNLGVSLRDLGRTGEEIESCNRTISLKPDFARAHLSRAIILLLTENFKEGWQEYEWRLRREISSFPIFQQPKWDGSSLNGKSILVHTEQGLGDTVQFVRYLPMVQARGGHVIFKCHQEELDRLLRNCKGFDELAEQNQRQKAQSDVYIPLASLPGIFNTTFDTIPSRMPYIKADSKLVAQWHAQLSHDSNFKVGIVWAGNPRNSNDYNRSCSLADFAPLANIPNVTFYSLQVIQYSAYSVPEIKAPMKIIDLENKSKDFADTAAIIANLDLVISVDTAVAHLAGALNKPVWTLLTFAPGWRWLLNRDDSPWYPSMRLFRQTRPNDWKGVFQRVKEELLLKGVELCQ